MLRVARGVRGRASVALAPLAILVIVALFPIALAPDRYYVSLGIFVGVFYIVCLGLSLIFGFAKQLSLAQAAYYGIGAYTSALLTTRLGMPVSVGFLAAVLVTGLLGWLLAAPILRLRYFYLAMATLAFGEIVITIIEQERWLTGGSTGIINLPAPALGPLAFDTSTKYFYLVWAVVLACLYIARNIVRSRIGLGLKALGDSEVGAEALGIDVARYKTWMFTIGAMYAGIAGALFVHFMTFISPGSFTVEFSLLVVMMLAVGGMDSLFGAFLGALFVVVLPSALAGYEEYSRLLFAIVFVAVIMLMPRGLAGLISDGIAWSVGQWDRLTRRSKGGEI